MQTQKNIVISYSEEDKETARSLRNVLIGWLGDTIWMRDFDLDGGDIATAAIDIAVSDAKWFLIIVSKASVNSNWLRHEANIATTRSLEDMGFRIIVIEKENCIYPRYAELALKTQKVFDISNSDDIERDFITIAEYIHQSISPSRVSDVYVGRGKDTDDFGILARRNHILFIVGWPGIGKTSFVVNSLRRILRKRPLIVHLTNGHSLDRLCREIIALCHAQQPIVKGDDDQDDLLLNEAIVALKSRAPRQFLVLDNGEQVFAPDNSMLPFIDRFLTRIVEESLDTHIIIPSTRNPAYSVEIARRSDIYRLDGLEAIFVRESLELLLQEDKRIREITASPRFNDVIDLIGGHPLAAKMAASYLKVKTPEQLLSTSQRQRFRLQFANLVIRSTGQEILTELHKLLLEILATVRAPISLDDALSISELAKYNIDDIQQARVDLSDWFLIEQHGERMSLHSFIAAYFRDEVQRKDDLVDHIARDFGRHAYHKAISLNDQLQDAIATGEQSSSEYAELSNEVFRYAVPAARLLRTAKEDGLADLLPIQVKGTTREMVFYFYQEKQDYKTALTYASNWLNIYPNDVEISLYQARCYRQMDDKVSLETANILIDKLRIHAGNNVFASRLFREKAMIAERLGDIDSAITFYEQGIAVEGRRPYPENYIGLARILVDQAEMLPEDSTIQQEVATRAVELLNIAREESSTFERLHLGLYAHALIEAGQEERALPLLEEALAERPEDGRLNFRMAEILRKKGMFRESEKFAKVALSNHIDEALLTLANILYSEGIDLQSSPTSNDASTMFLRAIDYTTQYKSQVTRAGSIEVADGIISKIFRALDDWDAAEKILTKYKNSSGQYIVYEQCKVYLRKSEIAQSRGDQASAIEELNIARSCIANVKFGLSKQLAEVNSEINLRQKLLSVL